MQMDCRRPWTYTRRAFRWVPPDGRQPGDRLRVVEAHVLPGFAGVGRLVNAVALHDLPRKSTSPMPM